MSQKTYKMHRHYVLFGVLILWTAVFLKVECKKITGRLPESSLITGFVRDFIKPFLQSLQLTDYQSQSSANESPLKKAIKRTIYELGPFLQDEDRNDHKRAQDSLGDTTIIEFLPQSDSLRKGKEALKLRTKIHKYEKLKLEIKAALEKESVSERTKNMVTRTLNNLIKQVIKNQCTWKSVDHSSAIIKAGRSVNHSITTKEWQDLSEQYTKFLESKHMNRSVGLFSMFDKFFFNLINDTKTSSKHYKIKCQVINVDGNANVAQITKIENSCEDFKVCSEEIKEFLLDFYKTLNDTTVSVFKNYAAMYTRDVIAGGDDSESTESVPKILVNMGNDAERRVSKIFIQQLDALKLDPRKDKEANIKTLREFVGNTVKRILKHVKKQLATDLVSLRTRLLIPVKQDLTTNLNVDLGNQESDIKGRICTVFVTCNGRVYGIRRTKEVVRGEPRNLLGNRNSVYVKVQLNLDDNLKDDMLKSNRELFRSILPQSHKNMNNILDTNKNLEENRRYSNLIATRTTVLAISTTESNNPNVSAVNVTAGNVTEVTEDYIKNSILEKFK